MLTVPPVSVQGTIGLLPTILHVLTICQFHTDTTMEGQIKLVDGPTLTEGRLMINYKDHYGAVCDDRFDTQDANLVCHQLGFAGQERITGCCPYGRRRCGEIWLDELGCTSQDVWLANCTHRGWGMGDCHPGEEIGVKCNREFHRIDSVFHTSQ